MHIYLIEVIRMEFEHKMEGQTQIVTLKNRKNLEITGIKKIESLNSEEFFIHTNLGDMLVRGEQLEMQHLDIEKGILWINGLVYSIEYVESLKKNKNKSSFMGKLFK